MVQLPANLWLWRYEVLKMGSFGKLPGVSLSYEHHNCMNARWGQWRSWIQQESWISVISLLWDLEVTITKPQKQIHCHVCSGHCEACRMDCLDSLWIVVVLQGAHSPVHSFWMMLSYFFLFWVSYFVAGHLILGLIFFFLVCAL